ncbi:EF hand domain-containing protein [Toxoplasma gondii RUB]|uniref:EF hand domain-containing protein n=1 Tax=Toxoplasma gondii RUB TaxID=935652 RepID=A0A086M259_TOXGO|nr:EF hand domain-containing protein [Toxoplasma gondii RUB]
MAGPPAVSEQHRAHAPGVRAPGEDPGVALAGPSSLSASRLASVSGQPNMQDKRAASASGAEAGERRRDIQRAFALFDRDGDGRLDRRELKAACRALGLKVDDFMIDSLLRVSGGSTSPIGSSSSSSPSSSSSLSVDFNGFLELCVGTWPQRSSTEELREIFRLFDTDQKGYVTAADVARAAKAVGSSLSAEDVDLMVREADRTGDGRLSFGDFERVFRRMRGVPGRPEGEALEVVVDDDDEDDL